MVLRAGARRTCRGRCSQAIHIANLPAKGPVYVSVPYDDWAQEAPAETKHLLTRATTTAGSLSADQLATLVDALDRAENPVLVLGLEVDAEYANDDAVRLADALWRPRLDRAVPVTVPRSPTRHRSFRGVLPPPSRASPTHWSGTI